jgi:hypothetical protein
MGAMEIFEIRLREARPSSSLLFVTMRKNSDEAVEHARRLLERHPEFDAAEVWYGMKLVREV